MDYLVKLYELPPLDPYLQKIHAHGIIIKRALPPEMHVISKWVQTNFSPVWASECRVSFSNHPPTCLVALKERVVVGFCCYEATCKGFIGPCGVHKEFRNRGVGKALIMKSFYGLAELGYAYGILGAAIDVYYEKHFSAMPIPDSTPGIYKNLVR